MRTLHSSYRWLATCQSHACLAAEKPCFHNIAKCRLGQWAMGIQRLQAGAVMYMSVYVWLCDEHTSSCRLSSWQPDEVGQVEGLTNSKATNSGLDNQQLKEVHFSAEHAPSPPCLPIPVTQTEPRLIIPGGARAGVITGAQTEARLMQLPRLGSEAASPGVSMARQAAVTRC